MKYIGEFRSVDNILYGVEIITNNDESEETPIVLAGEEPVLIEQDSDGLFTPIKGKACTIKLVSKEYYFDMYTSVPQGTLVKVINKTFGKIEFRGYLTPNIYSQEYRYLNEVELEAVEAISTLKYFKWKHPDFIETDIASFYQILKYLLHTLCGYDYIYVNSDLYLINSQVTEDLLNKLHINTLNFYDDDGVYKEDNLGLYYDAESWECYEVLEEICKFLNCSCLIHQNEVYLLNYNSINYEDRSFIKYDFTTDTTPSSYTVSYFYTIDGDSYKDEGAEISLTPSYNKINIKCNEYPQEEIIIPPLSDDYLSKLNRTVTRFETDDNVYLYHFLKSGDIKSAGLDYYMTIWNNKLYSVGETTEDIIQYSLRNLDVIITTYTNYNPFPPLSGLMLYNGSFFWEYAYYKKDEQKPFQLDVKKQLVLINTPFKENRNVLLSPKAGFNIISPSYGVNYIRISGSYKHSYSVFCEGDDSTDRKIPFPFSDDAIPICKMCIIVGNKVWVSDSQNGDIEEGTWEECEDEDDNGNPIPSTRQYCWLSTITDQDPKCKQTYQIGGNFTFEDNINTDGGFVIPFKSSDKLNGTLKVILYSFNKFLGQGYTDTSICPYYTIFDELDFSVVDSLGKRLTGLPDEDLTEETDTTYYNVPEETYVDELDSIELKINTQVIDKPTSYSSVLFKDEDSSIRFVSYLKSHSLEEVSQPQEYNIIEQQYNHYSSPKISLTLSVPYRETFSSILSNITIFRYPSLTNDNRNFFMDTTTIDLKANKQEVNLIEF